MKSAFRLILILCTLLTATAGAQTWQTFELHAAAPMVGRSVDVYDPNGSGTNAGTFALSQDAGGYAVLGGVSVCVDENAPEQVSTFVAGGRVAYVTCSTLLEAIASGLMGANGSDHVLSLTFTGGGSVEFLETAYYDTNVVGYVPVHSSLALVQSGAFTALSFGEMISGYTVQGEYYELFRGSAAGDPAQPFYVVDLSAGQRTPAGATHLGLASWSPDTTTIYPLRTASFYLHPENSGYSFTLHYQIPNLPEMVQTLTASPTGSGSSVGFSGSVAAGSYFWLTRGVDGWSPGGAQMELFAPDATLHWEDSSSPPPEDLQTIEFYLPSGMSPGYVHQPGADRALSEVIRNGVLVDYDTINTPHDFNYEVRTATIDRHQQFWLEINGTEVSQGEQWYYNGWSAIGGPPETPPPQVSGTLWLTLPAERANNGLSLTGPGNVGQFTLSSFGSSSISTPDLWHGTTWERSVVTSQIPYSTEPGTWSLFDQGTYETVNFSPGDGDFSLDLKDWWLSSELIPLQLSLSRWGHDLRLRHPNGEEYAITSVQEQGELFQLNGGNVWYQSYYYFDASGHRRGGLECWVRDMTTGEEAPWNQTNLIDWVYLPVPTEANAVAVGRPQSIEVTWHLPTQGQEALLGGGFQIDRSSNGSGWDALATLAATDARQAGTTDGFHYRDHALFDNGLNFKYRISYAYGGQSGQPVDTPAVAIDLDSDWDGIPDAWEIAHNLLWQDASDAAADADFDGFSNLEEFLAGTDPRDPAPLLTVTAPVGAALVRIGLGN